MPRRRHGLPARRGAEELGDSAGFIRPYGENFIHVDEIDLFVMAGQAAGGAPAPPARQEEVDAVEVICSLVAAELVNDGDTLQMGVGTVSAALAPCLDFHNDLGVQTELITGGIVDLVERGIVTRARKPLHPYKVVGSACVAMPSEELNRIHESPYFELYDFGYTDDLRRLIQHEHFVAVNNALVVDLTGQVSPKRSITGRHRGRRPDRVHAGRRLFTGRQIDQRAAVQCRAHGQLATPVAHRAVSRGR